MTLAVHNGGPPIPAEMLPFVFDPLARGYAEACVAAASVLACSSRGRSSRHMAGTLG